MIDDPRGFARRGRATEAVFHSADALEVARAFAEKRTPVWRGE
ncbi:hypothetical protein [Embleya scabrispora]|nr:hypothetical protein [Embleya scabrispora]